MKKEYIIDVLQEIVNKSTHENNKINACKQLCRVLGFDNTTVTSNINITKSMDELSTEDLMAIVKSNNSDSQ